MALVQDGFGLIVFTPASPDAVDGVLDTMETALAGLTLAPA